MIGMKYLDSPYTAVSNIRMYRVSFLEDQDVTLISLGEDDDKRNKSWAPVGEETVLAALERIVDSAHYPLLITCNTGKHRTGEKVHKHIRCSITPLNTRDHVHMHVRDPTISMSFPAHPTALFGSSDSAYIGTSNSILLARARFGTTQLARGVGM